MLSLWKVIHPFRETEQCYLKRAECSAALWAVQGFGLAQVIIRNGGTCTCSAKHSEVYL